MAPKVRYARSGDVHIDIVLVPGFVSHVNRFLDPERELEGVPDRRQVDAASSAS